MIDERDPIARRLMQRYNFVEGTPPTEKDRREDRKRRRAELAAKPDPLIQFLRLGVRVQTVKD